MNRRHMGNGGNCRGAKRNVTVDSEFAAFDQLPPEVRHEIRIASFPLGAESAQELVEIGGTRYAVACIRATDRDLQRLNPMIRSA